MKFFGYYINRSPSAKRVAERERMADLGTIRGVALVRRELHMRGLLTAELESVLTHVKERYAA